jgi:hypothetical protein
MFTGENGMYGIRVIRLEVKYDVYDILVLYKA